MMEEQTIQETEALEEDVQEGAPSPVLSYHAMSVAEKVKYGLTVAIPTGIGLEVLGASATGLALAGLAGFAAAFFSEEIRAGIIDRLPAPRSAKRSRASKLSWWITGEIESPVGEEGEQEGKEEINTEPLSLADESEGELDELDALFVIQRAEDTGGIERLTVAQIVEHCEFNGYKIFIGRSLTKPGNPAILISFYKQHFRFMGASQRGKSSMVAAFLDIVTRTHDAKHVRLILLDKEDQTSHLFAHLPHVLSMRKADGQLVKLWGRTDDQVLEYLIHTVAIMQHRYTLPKSQVLELPIILVYIEEFLALKNELKSRIDKAKGKEAKDQAQSDYTTFVYCIEELAQRGLKARVQLLLCAQVEYADDDFKEALVNVGCGFSFCVRPTAASAAGFRNNVLLSQNAKDNKIGQAVVETPDCNDLVLAPEYDLEARLLAFERAYPDLHLESRETIGSLFTESPDFSHKPILSLVASPLGDSQELPTIDTNGPVKKPECTPETFQPRGDDLQLSEHQTELLLVHYRHCGNINKSLEQIRNDRGQGLGGRYYRHAAYLLEQHGLKKRRA